MELLDVPVLPRLKSPGAPPASVPRDDADAPAQDFADVLKTADTNTADTATPAKPEASSVLPAPAQHARGIPHTGEHPGSPQALAHSAAVAKIAEGIGFAAPRPTAPAAVAPTAPGTVVDPAADVATELAAVPTDAPDLAADVPDLATAAAATIAAAAVVASPDIVPAVENQVAADLPGTPELAPVAPAAAPAVAMQPLVQPQTPAVPEADVVAVADEAQIAAAADAPAPAAAALPTAPAAPANASPEIAAAPEVVADAMPSRTNAAPELAMSAGSKHQPGANSGNGHAAPDHSGQQPQLATSAAAEAQPASAASRPQFTLTDVQPAATADAAPDVPAPTNPAPAPAAGLGALAANEAAPLHAPAAPKAAARAPFLQAAPTPAVQIAVNIAQAAAEGARQIGIRLHPAELGRVEVQLDIASDGRVSAVVLAERSDTLELLRNDARALERALQDAGLDPNRGGLKFGLREEGPDRGDERGFGRRRDGDDVPPEIAAATLRGGRWTTATRALDISV